LFVKLEGFVKNVIEFARETRTRSCQRRAQSKNTLQQFYERLCKLREYRDAPPSFVRL